MILRFLFYSLSFKSNLIRLVDSLEVKQLAKVRFPMRPTRTLGSHLFRIDGVFLPQQGDDTDPFYQEIEQETKLEAVRKMLNSGVDLESIAQWLDLPIEVVRNEANKKGRSRLWKETVNPNLDRALQQIYLFRW